MEEKAIASAVKSLAQIEVCSTCDHVMEYDVRYNSRDDKLFQHPHIEKPDVIVSTESGILTITRFHNMLECKLVTLVVYAQSKSGILMLIILEYKQV